MANTFSTQLMSPGQAFSRSPGAVVVLVATSLLVGCSTIETPSEPITALEPAPLPSTAPSGEVLTSLEPSNDRNWARDQQVLSYAVFHGDRVDVRNIRNCTYRSTEDYTVAHYDKTFHLDEIRSADLILTPFLSAPALAHASLSFGFEGDRYLGVSVEIRCEQGESYSPTKGLMRQYELMYVVADERDIIRLCTDHYLNDVYIYRLRLTPQQCRALFLDVMHRVNGLVERPEFYNTFSNNCTTNLVDHVNRVVPNKIPYSYHVLLPGLIDQRLYELGMIETDETTFRQAKIAARINAKAYLDGGSPQFSANIRSGRLVR